MKEYDFFVFPEGEVYTRNFKWSSKIQQERGSFVAIILQLLSVCIGLHFVC